MPDEVKSRIDKLNKGLNNSSDKKYSKFEINVPDEMKIGIEYEFFGATRYADLICEKYNYEKHPEKTIVHSYLQPHEAVTPPMGQENIADSLNFAHDLAQVGMVVNDTCGLHMHFDSEFFNVKESDGTLNLEATKYVWRSFMTMWQNSEEFMYSIVNKQGELPRNCSKSFFAKTISDKMEQMLNLEVMNPNSTETLEAMKFFITETQKREEIPGEEKYYSINFCRLLDLGTIEMRLANGTLEAEEIKKTLELYINFFEKSKELGIIDYKVNNKIELTKSEKEILLDRKIFFEEKDSDKKINNMLGLLFDDNFKKQVYINRYSENSKILDDYEIEYQINGEKVDDSISIAPVIVTPSDIARLDMQQQLTIEELSLAQRLIKKLQEIKNRIFKNDQESINEM